MRGARPRVKPPCARLIGGSEKGMDREEINKALCARIGAEYRPPFEGKGTWDDRARRFEVLGSPHRGAGRLDYLRVEKSGNFGNNYIQLVHAMALAEVHGVKRVLHRFRQFGARKGTLGPKLTFRRSMELGKLGLSGTFFLRAMFDELCDLPPEQFLRISDAYVRPALLLEQPKAEKGVVALNIRGGADVFENRMPNKHYGQPPLSYYQRALANLTDRYELSEVNLVYQDVRNPVVEPLTVWLQGLGVPWRLTSEGILGDARALMEAEHIVMGWTTFTSAVSLLSSNMRTVTVFRKAPLFREMCVAAEAAYLIRDAGGEYIPVDGWKNDRKQRKLMVDYPVENLSIEDKAEKRQKLAARIQGYQTRRRARFRRWFKR